VSFFEFEHKHVHKRFVPPRVEKERRNSNNSNTFVPPANFIDPQMFGMGLMYQQYLQMCYQYQAFNQANDDRENSLDNDDVFSPCSPVGNNISSDSSLPSELIDCIIPSKDVPLSPKDSAVISKIKSVNRFFEEASSSTPHSKPISRKRFEYKNTESPLVSKFNMSTRRDSTKSNLSIVSTGTRSLHPNSIYFRNNDTSEMSEHMKSFTESLVSRTEELGINMVNFRNRH